MEIKNVIDVFQYLTHPLALIGFVLLLFFNIQGLLIKSKIIRISQSDGSVILKVIFRYGFLISITTIILGFSLSFYKKPPDNPVNKFTINGDNGIQINQNTGELVINNEDINYLKPTKIAEKKQ